MKRERKGFTLLELLMVVIILGILASVALPQFMRTAERSRVAEALNVLGAVRSSEQRYQAEWGNFTNVLTKLDVSIVNGNWFNFSGDAAAAGNCGVATRTSTDLAAGNSLIGATLKVNLNSGAKCSSSTDAANAYGIVSGTCC